MSEISKRQMLEFIDSVDGYLRSGDGDWDITSNPDPDVEESLKAIRRLIESSGGQPVTDEEPR